MMSGTPDALIAAWRSIVTNSWHPGHKASVQTSTSTFVWAEATAKSARRRMEEYCWRERGGATT